jgi:DNA repair exonuclease SbcCD ATPase subunit
MTKNNSNEETKETKQEICPICGKVHPKREDLNIKATRDEVESMILINNRVNVAEQAAQPTALQQGVTQEQVQVFVNAALNAKAEALNLQRQWWNEIFAKYPQLPRDKNVFVDFDTCDFYIQIEQ